MVGLGSRTDSPSSQANAGSEVYRGRTSAYVRKGLSVDRDIVEGRWRVHTRHRGQWWEVIVEPDYQVKLLVVITAYSMENY